MGRLQPVLYAVRGRPTPFPLDPLKRQLMLKHAVLVVVTHHLYRLQLPVVPPGSRLRVGAHQKPRMVHVRLHAPPPPPAVMSVIGSTPYRNICTSAILVPPALGTLIANAPPPPQPVCVQCWTLLPHL